MNQAVLGNLASHHLAVFPMPSELTNKLDSLQMRFWWGKKENEKGYYPKGWRDIALPKDLGGLNIRRNEILNLALLTKLAWRLIENPDDKWACILRGKYFANSNPLTGSVYKQGSWIWNGICTGLAFIKKIMCGRLEMGNLCIFGKTIGFQICIVHLLLLYILQIWCMLAN